MRFSDNGNRIPRLLLLLSLTGPISTGSACSITHIPSPENLISSADLIVRVTAVRYRRPPKDNRRTTGHPDTTVEFRVREVLKGDKAPRILDIPAYLTQRDDFYKGPMPLRGVRLEGLMGSCFANTYKQGADFLLFLKRQPEKKPLSYTPYWAALAPVNEQVRPARDPWVRWVKTYLKARTKLKKVS